MRLNAVRELMRMELPDRMTDLYLRDGTGNWVVSDHVGGRSYRLLRHDSRRTVPLLRRPGCGFSGELWPTPLGARSGLRCIEQSECLYMIMAGIREADTTGLEWFDGE